MFCPSEEKTAFETFVTATENSILFPQLPKELPALLHAHTLARAHTRDEAATRGDTRRPALTGPDEGENQASGKLRETRLRRKMKRVPAVRLGHGTSLSALVQDESQVKSHGPHGGVSRAAADATRASGRAPPRSPLRQQERSSFYKGQKPLRTKGQLAPRDGDDPQSQEAGWGPGSDPGLLER